MAETETVLRPSKRGLILRYYRLPVRSKATIRLLKGQYKRVGQAV